MGKRSVPREGAGSFLEDEPRLPRLFSKKDMCRVLDCWHPSGRPNYFRLNRFFLTERILEKAGITREEYRKARVFTYKQGKGIVKALEMEDLWEGS